MKQFILGVAVGVVADRLVTGNLDVGKVTNEDILAEVRKHLKTIDEKLAEKQAADNAGDADGVNGVDPISEVPEG